MERKYIRRVKLLHSTKLLEACSVPELCCGVNSYKVKMDNSTGVQGHFGFVWQGSGSKGATGVASVRSCQKLPQCSMEPVPAGSKTDLLLVKAEPISDGGSASVITYLRRKKYPAQGHFLQQEGGVRILQMPRSVKKERLQAPEQRFACSPWSRPW